MITEENLTNLEYQENNEERREKISYIFKKHNIAFSWRHHTLAVEMKDIPQAVEIQKSLH